jgi:anti-anti-sigma factor
MRIEDNEGTKIIRMDSGISSANRHDFEMLIEDLTNRSNVIVDVSHAPMITSSGLNSLLDASTSARKKGKRVVLMGATPDLMLIMEKMDIYEFFTFVDTVEEGMRKIKYYT